MAGNGVRKQKTAMNPFEKKNCTLYLIVGQRWFLASSSTNRLLFPRHFIKETLSFLPFFFSFFFFSFHFFSFSFSLSLSLWVWLYPIFFLSLLPVAQQSATFRGNGQQRARTSAGHQRIRIIAIITDGIASGIVAVLLCRCCRGSILLLK